MRDTYFHTIKSILNLEYNESSILDMIYFHTIKSILNTLLSLSCGSEAIFPYY